MCNDPLPKLKELAEAALDHLAAFEQWQKYRDKGNAFRPGWEEEAGRQVSRITDTEMRLLSLAEKALNE